MVSADGANCSLSIEDEENKNADPPDPPTVHASTHESLDVRGCVGHLEDWWPSWPLQGLHSDSNPRVRLRTVLLLVRTAPRDAGTDSRYEAVCRYFKWRRAKSGHPLEYHDHKHDLISEGEAELNSGLNWAELMTAGGVAGVVAWVVSNGCGDA